MQDPGTYALVAFSVAALAPWCSRQLPEPVSRVLFISGIGGLVLALVTIAIPAGW